MIAYLGFSKRYGSQRAVEDLTLEVGPGEVVALLGPNGSGKTTTTKAAAGLVRPSTGEVRLGRPGRPATDPEARRLVSFLPQKVTLPESLSGREVMEFYCALRGANAARVDEVLRFAALNGAADRLVGTYSGGMVQRLGLAVAILPDTPILLLDEPTAALDPDGLCAFYGLIETRRRAGATVFFSSHQMGDAERLADRFAILVQGRLVATLTQAELSARLADRGVMRVRLDRLPEGLLSTIQRRAPGARWVAGELLIPGPASARPEHLDSIRAAGAEIRGLTAEEGRLDQLYRELVGDVQHGSAALPARGGTHAAADGS